MIDIRYNIIDIRDWDTHEFSTACFHVYSLGRVAAIIEELYLHMVGLQVEWGNILSLMLYGWNKSPFATAKMI